MQQLIALYFSGKTPVICHRDSNRRKALRQSCAPRQRQNSVKVERGGFIPYLSRILISIFFPYSLNAV